VSGPSLAPLPDGHGPLASPGYHLLMAAQAWRRELGARLRPLGLTPTQFDTIGALGWLSRSIPDPTQQQVADFAGMDRMMLSKLVAGLEQRGLLVRLPDPVDARLRRLRLTDAGRELIGPASAIARAVDAELFAGESRAALRDQLRGVAVRANSLVE
jgi:DNA-binding MarR family transcriptional regulator